MTIYFNFEQPIKSEDISLFLFRNTVLKCFNSILSGKNEIMSHFVFRSSFKDKGSRVYEYDNK